VKRLQIYIEEELDEALALQAARRGTSKAALIRELVAARYAPGPGDDPLDALVGRYDAPSAAVDDLVYGPLGDPLERESR
jgi:Ribbon-helix-helix protein, copG family